MSKRSNEPPLQDARTTVEPLAELEVVPGRDLMMQINVDNQVLCHVSVLRNDHEIRRAVVVWNDQPRRLMKQLSLGDIGLQLAEGLMSRVPDGPPALTFRQRDWRILADLRHVEEAGSSSWLWWTRSDGSPSTRSTAPTLAEALAACVVAISRML